MARWSLLLFILALIVGFFRLDGGPGDTHDVAFGLFVTSLVVFLVLDIATARNGGIEAIRHTWSKPARGFRVRRGPLPRSPLPR